MKKIAWLLFFFLLTVSSLLARSTEPPRAGALSEQAGATSTVTEALIPTSTLIPTPTPTEVDLNEWSIPNFDHIALIVLENEYLQTVVGTSLMPNFTALAEKNVLLTNYAPITHPSLPNYLVLVSGSIQNITDNCMRCFVDAPNLADEIEASGRTWRAYFEDMPSPCFIGNRKPYEQFFNPFIYFDSIRLDGPRCKNSVVPLTQLDADLNAGHLPNFVYIAPNQCNSGHDCPASTADKWLGSIVSQLQKSGALGDNSLVIITFDEGLQPATPVTTNGEVATLLISPLAQHGYVDSTRFSHYSLLKTILAAWHLPALGDMQMASANVIVDPWVDEMGLIYPRALTAVP